MAPRFRAMAFAAVVGAMLVSLSGVATAGNERNGVYAVGGNNFIVRVHQQGGTIYLRAYRQAGDQWERYATTTIPAGQLEARRAAALDGSGSLVERIYFTGRLVGYSDLDLDNPLYTDLNRGGGECFSCN